MARTSALLTLLTTLTLLSGSGCIAKQGRFEQNRFQHEVYPYAVWYSKGATPNDVLGSDWRVDNYFSRDGSPIPTEAKTGSEYEVPRAYDTDGDGSYESLRDEPFYDLLLKHRKKDAALWIRSVPVDLTDANKELSVFAARYLDAVAGTGSVAVRFGSDGPVGFLEKRFAARKLDTRSCSVTGKPAYRLDFEVANVDQVQITPDARWSRGSLVIVRPGYTNTVYRSSAAVVHYPVLILIGLSASPEDYAELEPDLDRMLSQIVLGNFKQGLPLEGSHTCRAEARGAGGEVPTAAPVTGTMPAVPAPSPSDAAAVSAP